MGECDKPKLSRSEAAIRGWATRRGEKLPLKKEAGECKHLESKGLSQKVVDAAREITKSAPAAQRSGSGVYISHIVSELKKRFPGQSTKSLKSHLLEAHNVGGLKLKTDNSGGRKAQQSKIERDRGKDLHLVHDPAAALRGWAGAKGEKKSDPKQWEESIRAGIGTGRIKDGAKVRGTVQSILKASGVPERGDRRDIAVLRQDNRDSKALGTANDKGRITVGRRVIDSLNSTDPATFRSGLSTLLHEELHVSSPMTPSTYSKHKNGLALEEITTELGAKALLREHFGDKSESYSYAPWISSVAKMAFRTFGTNTYDKASGVRAGDWSYENMRRASLAFKREPGRIRTAGEGWRKFAGHIARQFGAGDDKRPLRAASVFGREDPRLSIRQIAVLNSQLEGFTRSLHPVAPPPPERIRISL